MSDGGSPEMFVPAEGGGAAPLEQLSEEAKQRFAAAAAAQQQIRRDEGRAKRKDDKLAKALVQFLNDPRYTHLFLPVARLIARNCPSLFPLCLISLIHEEALREVEEYFRDLGVQKPEEAIAQLLPSDGTAKMTPDMRQEILPWITRLQLVLAVDEGRVVESLLLDPSHIDGNVREVAVFVLQEFFRRHGKDAPYDKIQPLTSTILQHVMEPFLSEIHRTGHEAHTGLEEKRAA